jgi:hypothetical protein
MSSSSNGVDRRGFVVARASQYSLLSLLPVRATRTLSITGLAGSIEAANVCKSRTGRTSVHASTGRRAEKILRDGNRTITTQHGRDRSRWRLAGRHKTSFRLHQSGPAHKTHVVEQVDATATKTNLAVLRWPTDGRRRQSGDMKRGCLRHSTQAHQ